MKHSWKSPYRSRSPHRWVAGRAGLHRHRVAAVSFFNAKPLLAGLDDVPEIELLPDVPSRMLGLLDDGQADAALLPVIDLQRATRPLTVIPAGCIAAAGVVLTVRVFSHVRPERIQTLLADTDSHTSVALAQVLWWMRFKRRLRIAPLPVAARDVAADAQAVLMIGDKVVARPPIGFDFQFDLGQMWFEMTGLPFTFAVWAAAETAHANELHRVLSAARRDGTDHLHELAHTFAPQYNWPLDLAERYYTRCLQFDFTPAHREGLAEFFHYAAEVGVIGEVRPVLIFSREFRE